MFSNIKSSTLFKVGMLGVVLISLFTGLADSDWYWQVKLGESIVNNLKFNDFSSLVWGSDLSFYLDHEWLSNVIFYVLSLLPYGITVTKFILVSLCCLSTYLFVKSFNKHDDNVVIVFTLCILFLGSISVFKVKPYMFSFVLLLIEIYFLSRFSRKTSKLGIVIVSILWINLHGSYPLFICVFGLYIVCFLVRQFRARVKNVKMIIDYILTFIVSVLASLLNPFGYKLLLFNILHNSDSTMKVLVEDWKAVDCKTELGVLVFIVIVVYILSIKISKSLSLEPFLLSLAMLFLTLGSARHMIYLVPVVVYLLCSCDYSLALNKGVVIICCYASCVVGLASSISLFNIDNYDKEYGFNYVSDDTLSSIKNYYESDNYNGLFLNSVFNSVLGDGVKTFTNGIYPLVSDRVKDELYMTYYASNEDIETIIGYYDLTGFVVDKYSTYEGYSQNSVLYQYLVKSSDYICIDDTAYYGFFIHKSIVNKN